MNSNQVNFFMMPGDRLAMEEFLIENNFVFVKTDTQNKDDIFLKDLSEREYYQLFLLRQNSSDEIVHKYLEAKQYYYIDILRSCLIEFSLGGFYPNSQKELHRARLYYSRGYFIEENKFVEKDAEFLKSAAGLFKAFKQKFLKKSPLVSGASVTEKCLRWIAGGNASLAKGDTVLISEQKWGADS